MFKNKMNLTAQICIIPFSNFLFYKKDYIKEIAKKKMLEIIINITRRHL